MEIEGFESLEAMYEFAISDSVCPAICINENCNYTTDMEPDQDKGWCDNCNTNTVQSCLVLGGLI
jgi:hypothetical protein